MESIPQSIVKILVVDNQLANLVALKELFIAVEAEVIMAQSGHEALQLCLQRDFALVLLEVDMPVMDGYAVAASLRASCQTLPVIFMAASCDQEINWSDGHAAGVVDCISKPIDGRMLLAKVSVFLELYHQRYMLVQQSARFQAINLGLEIEIKERKKVEEKLCRAHELRTVRHLLLQTILEPLILFQQLEKILEIILAVPWLSVQDKGAIFLIDEDTGELIMMSQRNLPDYLLGACARIAPGFCLCGRAAMTREVVFSTTIDDRHDVRYEGMEPHGHYCAPIMHGETLLGVLNLYLEEGHTQDAEEKAMLFDITKILAEIIDRQRVDAALIRAKEMAEDASYAKGRFLATMSHEIRTPLNGILGFAELLTKSDLTKKQHLYAETIMQSGKHLHTIISDILDFSKIEAGKVVLEDLPFVLDNLLDSAINLVSLLAQERGLELRLSLSPDVPIKLSGDPNRLRQVLFNLLANAIKFTERGRVHLAVAVEREEERRVFLRFCVQDTGIGISPEHFNNLFKPFGQADRSTTSKYGGTGLGLVICAELVRMMGGSLAANSEQNVGSEFWFTAWFSTRLHVETVDATPRMVAEVDLVALGKDSRLLVVEDNRINRLFILEILQSIGFTNLVAASNGLEALERLDADSFDLVLMDCQMPEMDGYDATREIRRREITLNHGKRLPVIALTANAMEGDREKCLAAGMDDFLTKPLGLNVLKHTLSLWLTKKSPTVAARPSATVVVFPAARALSPNPEATMPLDLAEFAELRTLFGTEKLTVLVKAFLDSLPEKISGVREAIIQDDSERLHREAHILKGNCGMIKAVPMFRVCQELVNLGRSGSTQGAEALLALLEAESDRLGVALQNLVSGG